MLNTLSAKKSTIYTAKGEHPNNTRRAGRLLPRRKGNEMRLLGRLKYFAILGAMAVGTWLVFNAIGETDITASIFFGLFAVASLFVDAE